MIKINTQTYQKIVRYSGLYDLLLTMAFAFPIIAAFKLGLLRDLHFYFELPGHFPEFEPMHLFFINLTGSAVTVWSFLRVKYNIPVLGLYDSYGRFLFSLAMLYALIAGQGTFLLLFFLIPEFIWGVVQMYLYYQIKDKQPVSQQISALA